MRRIGFLSIMLTSLAFLSAVTPSAWAEQQSKFMALGSQVSPPRGYLEFCARTPTECPEFHTNEIQATSNNQRAIYWSLLFASTKSVQLVQNEETGASGVWHSSDRGNTQTQGRQLIALTSREWTDLNKVNRSVNSAITPRSDLSTYGVEDYWAEPLAGGRRYGDCEDFVLEKRRALLNLGYPREALSIATVRTAWNQDHAVLLVETDNGEMVLDSLSDWINSWRTVSYKWISRQSPVDPAVWVSGPPLGR